MVLDLSPGLGEATLSESTLGEATFESLTIKTLLKREYAGVQGQIWTGARAGADQRMLTGEGGQARQIYLYVRLMRTGGHNIMCAKKCALSPVSHSHRSPYTDNNSCRMSSFLILNSSAILLCL